jgi:K+ transporter
LLHTRIVLLHVVTENIPRVPPQRRVEVTHLGSNFHAVVARYGFVEQPDVARGTGGLSCPPAQFRYDGHLVFLLVA